MISFLTMYLLLGFTVIGALTLAVLSFVPDAPVKPNRFFLNVALWPIVLVVIGVLWLIGVRVKV